MHRGNLSKRAEMAVTNGFSVTAVLSVNQLADNLAQLVLRTQGTTVASCSRNTATVSQVRGSARRSAKPAKEIKDLIQDSVKKVEDGPALLAQSEPALPAPASALGGI